MSDVFYKLDELARAAGTSARTVRYYVQRGLLPAPTFRGKDSTYGHEHLVRLRAIRKMQDAFFPLDAIAIELERRSLADVERIADGHELPTQPKQQDPTPTPPAAPPAALSMNVEQRIFHRMEIAPGLELSIADDAPLLSKSLLETLLRVVRKNASQSE